MKTIKLYTFAPSFNNKEYSLFDGKEEQQFKTSSEFFDYLIDQIKKYKKIVLFGYNVLNRDTITPLMQESFSRGYLPTPKGGNKITSCYLKSNQLVIKDAKHFRLAETNQLDKLYEIIQQLEKTAKKSHKTSIIEKVSTLAKVSWTDFWKTNQQDRQTYHWDKIWDLNKEEDEFIRQAFRGGYLDLFNEQNYRGKVSDWDFKNFYPSVMARYPFPTSQPQWIKHPRDFYGKGWKKEFYGFYQCEVECLENNPYPFFTQKDETGIHIYRPGKYQAVLFSEEIKFFWQYTPGIKVEVGEGYTFNTRQYIFRNWVMKLYKAQIQGDELAKLKMNSLFGAFGTAKEHNNFVWTKEKTSARISEFTTKTGEKIYLTLSETPKHSWGFTNVAIAAAITAYGRITLYHALLANWNNVLYCATDGFVLKSTQNNYQAKPIFANCGQLLNKGEYQGFISLAPNVYAFYDKEKKLVGKGFLQQLTSQKLNFLFEKKITEENVKKVWENAPQRHEWGVGLNQMLTEIAEQKKKQLVNGKWEIYQ